MKKISEIEYKLVVKSPISIHAYSSNGKIIIPASVLKGAIRNVFHIRQKRSIASQNTNHLIEEKMFGGQVAAGFTPSNFIITDAVCGDTQRNDMVLMNRMSLKSSNLTHHKVIPAGTEFFGKIIFNKDTSGFERSIALSSLLELSYIGANRNLGMGQCDIQIISRSNTMVFISYSWEDDLHMDWVLRLAMQLANYDLDILLDQLSPSFNINAPQEETNGWMNQCIQNCDKIIAVLTPTYKLKAEGGYGGVGFEYKQLYSEIEMISPRLNRYVGVLRKGDVLKSVPKLIHGQDIIEMTNINNERINLSELITALKSS